MSKSPSDPAPTPASPAQADAQAAARSPQSDSTAHTDHPATAPSAPLTADSAKSDTPQPEAQPVGMGQVLPHVRQPEEIKVPHVVEFRNVIKTYNFGEANAYTAIKNI